MWRVSGRSEVGAMPSTIQTDSAVESEVAMPVGVNRLAQYGLVAVIVTSAANSVIRVAALAVFDIPVEFLPLRGFTIAGLTMGWGPVVLFTTLGAVGATIVYGVITRYSHRPTRTFTIVAAVVLVLSFGAFLAPLPVLSGAPSAAFATLAVMHVTAAATSVGVLRRATGQRPSE
jgi:hypothetical protein